MNDAYQIVRDFEQAMSEFTSAPYAVTVESCSAAIFLCCKYLYSQGSLNEVEVPKYTYPSVPSSIINAGVKVRFIDLSWQSQGYYVLKPTPVIDSAKRLERGMYQDFHGMLVCLSFHGKKHLRIGRGGMVLTDQKCIESWLKCARFDGRHEKPLHQDTLTMAGWNMYMTPEQAARGLEQLQWIGDGGILTPDPYQDLSKYKFFTETKS